MSIITLSGFEKVSVNKSPAVPVDSPLELDAIRSNGMREVFYPTGRLGIYFNQFELVLRTSRKTSAPRIVLRPSSTTHMVELANLCDAYLNGRASIDEVIAAA